MKAIGRRSAAAVTFVGLLGLSLTAPQRQHVERCADLLVVAPRRKTLAQLVALELPGIDASNLSDFFRISPWDADNLRLPLVAFILVYLKARMANPTLPIFFTFATPLQKVKNRPRGPTPKGAARCRPVFPSGLATTACLMMADKVAYFQVSPLAPFILSRAISLRRPPSRCTGYARSCT